ncbi:hypothetical protein MRX96_037248 [Rhipicephalus microplus]
MQKFVILLACICVAAAQRGFAPVENYPPIPAATPCRWPTAARVPVTYTADENGYRAEIVTNEQGTESKNPADVVIQSSALPGPEAAIANEPNRLRG